MPSSAVTDHALADAPAVLRPALRGRSTAGRSRSPSSSPRCSPCGSTPAASWPPCSCTARASPSMLAVSGTYHARRLAHRERRLLRRLDHTMILVGTAGTYTAVIVLALDGTTRVVLLVVAWSFVRRRGGHPHAVARRAAGADRPRLPRRRVADPARPAGVRRRARRGRADACSPSAAASTASARSCTRRSGPNPWPAVFGYHEVFHSLVVAAAAVPLGRRAPPDRLTVLFHDRHARRHRPPVR